MKWGLSITTTTTKPVREYKIQYETEGLTRTILAHTGAKRVEQAVVEGSLGMCLPSTVLLFVT